MKNVVVVEVVEVRGKRRIIAHWGSGAGMGAAAGMGGGGRGTMLRMRM